MRRFAVLATTMIVLCASAQAADQIILASLSGSLSPPGQEGKRGMDVALEELGQKLGNIPRMVKKLKRQKNGSFLRQRGLAGRLG